jgi:hypothetical protein
LSIAGYRLYIGDLLFGDATAEHIHHPLREIDCNHTLRTARCNQRKGPRSGRHIDHPGIRRKLRKSDGILRIAREEWDDIGGISFRHRVP